MAKPDGKSQLDKFKEAAREVDADEDPEAFDRAFGKVVTPGKPD